MRKIKLCFILLFVSIISCVSKERSEIISLYSSDKSQVISVISSYSSNIRIIANGKYSKKPNSSFYELDISKVPTLGDAICVCWKDNGWELVNDISKIIQSKIDTSRFKLRENWFEDEGMTNTKYYIQKNCFIVDLLNYTDPFPEGNGNVEHKSLKVE